MGGETPSICDALKTKIEDEVLCSSSSVCYNFCFCHLNLMTLGIGHAFFKQVKEIASQRHANAIELQVNAMNKQAYDMYAKCGFREKSINMELNFM